MRGRERAKRRDQCQRQDRAKIELGNPTREYAPSEDCGMPAQQGSLLYDLERESETIGHQVGWFQVILAKNGCLQHPCSDSAYNIEMMHETEDR